MLSRWGSPQCLSSLTCSSFVPAAEAGKEDPVAGKQKKEMEAEKLLCQNEAAEAQGALSEEGQTESEDPQTAVDELCESEEQRRERVEADLCPQASSSCGPKGECLTASSILGS